jgi:16S rRNA (uracil1498-N3)-methyltransferase
MRQSAAYERRTQVLRPPESGENRQVSSKRVYIDGALSPGVALELPHAAALHLGKVMRVRSGDTLVLFTGDGREFAATVESVRGPRVMATVGEARSVDRESPLAVTLTQGIARGDRMDLIVQKATELGVARIVPVLSRRSVVRLDTAQAQAKAAHWRSIAVNACEQCGRNRLPLIDAPRPLLEHLAAPAAGGARLLLEPEAAAAAHGETVERAVEIAIGPEGGFDPDELEAFRVSGFAPARLGPRVLRTETAAIAALVWLQSRFGDLRTG